MMMTSILEGIFEFGGGVGLVRILFQELNDVVDEVSVL